MALWQVEFISVPKEKIKRESIIDNINIIDLWNGYELKQDSIFEVEKVLKRTKGWSKNILQLGIIDETVIEILYDKDNIEEITYRLDLRNINTRIMEVIVYFININNLAIIVNDKLYLNITKESIVKIIKASDAYKFINNPEKFLDEIS